MNIINLPYNIIMYICGFLESPDLVKLREVCNFFRKQLIHKIGTTPEDIRHNKIFYLDISKIILNIPTNITAIKVDGYTDLKMIKNPNINTIIVENLVNGRIAYDMLDVENLHILNILRNNTAKEYKKINLKYLYNIKKLYSYGNMNIKLPVNLEKLHLKHVYNKILENYLDISSIKIDIPYTVRVLKVKNSFQLNMCNIPPMLDTIIIKYINCNIEKLNVKNLYVRKMDHNCIKCILWVNLNKLENIYTKNYGINFQFPPNIKKIYCKRFSESTKITLDYLECEQLNLFSSSLLSYIKVIKLKKMEGAVSIPNCDKLILMRNNKLKITYTGKIPEIVYEN